MNSPSTASPNASSDASPNVSPEPSLNEAPTEANPTEANAATALPKGSRVLVTGATGFTGSLLTHKLVGQGVEVVAIARPTSNIQQFDGLPIQWFKGDVFDADLIEQAMAGVTHIFHMVTPFREAKSPM